MNKRKTMRCNGVREKLSAYRDRELGEAAVRSVARHLTRCADCRGSLNDLQRVDALMRGLPELDPGPEFTAQVLARAGRVDALGDRVPPKRTVFSSFMQVFESLYDLFERKRLPSTRTLEEFGDFPPCSMSGVYFKIIGEPSGG